MSTIIIDASTTSYVITCTACSHWYAFHFGQPEAEASALRHEELVHPETTTLRDRLATRDRVRRHRERAAM